MAGGPYNRAASFCRDCGNPLQKIAGEQYCVNENKNCKPLGPQNRNYCEHQGCPNPGPVACPNCGNGPLHR